MPDSPFYARLEAVAHLNHEDSGASDLEKLRSHLETAKELVAKVKENPGITGQIKSAIGEKLSSYIAGFELREQNLTSLRSNHEEACRAIASAHFRQLCYPPQSQPCSPSTKRSAGLA